MWKETGIGIGGFIAILVIGMALSLGGVYWYKFIGPKREAARIQQLSKMRLEYLRSKDPNDKAAIAATVRHQFADYKKQNLPADLRAFLDKVNN
jgi:hypothetical protein